MFTNMMYSQPLAGRKTIRMNALAILLCIQLLLVSGVVPVRAQTRDKFVTGINYPWIAYGHDFGKNGWGHDGLITAGWTYQTYIDSQGFTDARLSKLTGHTGQGSLAISANLIGGDPNKAQGEVYLDLQTHTPKGVTVPINLKNVSVECWLKLPAGSAGDPQHPNGMQLFFKSQGFRSLYSPNLNILPEWEGIWVKFTVNASGPAGFQDPDYDPTKIIAIGLKVAINSQSTRTLDGQIFLDDYVISTNPTIVFDFEKLEIENDFAELQQALGQCSTRAVRVFIFTDGRASPDFTPDGDVVGFDEYFFSDFDALLATARQANVLLIPVLLDFSWFDTPQVVSGVQLGGHSDVVRNATKRQRFLDHVLKPLVERYHDEPQILAWEIINEPEWAMQEVPKDFQIGDPVTIAEMQSFVQLCAQTIHASTSNNVTVGSARRMWLNYWQGLGLDLYQFHWYDKFQQSVPEDAFPWLPYSSLGLDKPSLVGEVPTASTIHSTSEFLNAAFNRGYQGLLVWSYRAGDRFSTFSTAKPLLQTWCANTTNPIDDAQFFVRQHYLDFLNREPDASGLAFWTNEIASCGEDQSCIEVKRINVSAAFFLSIEFQQTGYLVYRTYKVAYGNLPGAPVPLRLSEFLPDTQKIGQGVIVNQAGWETVLENNKRTFTTEFVQRSRFTSACPPTMTPVEFVDLLFGNGGVVPSSSDREAAIGEFGSATTTADVAARARALRRVAENSMLQQQEFNRAFVLMQYFGYLRRNPNDPPEPTLDFQGYNFWLTKLNQFNGNFINAEMAKAFITSIEYRQRFGP
jgi:hypothetical protein